MAFAAAAVVPFADMSATAGAHTTAAGILIGPRLLQCEVSLVSAENGVAQNFVLCIGDVVRIGRAASNDVVIDSEGVSNFHAELFMRPPAGDLCVRDNSKNGTGARDGVGSGDNQSELDNGWRTLRRGEFVELCGGSQLVVPLKRGGKAVVDAQASPSPTLTVRVGRRLYEEASDGKLLGGDACMTAAATKDLPPPQPPEFKDTDGDACEAPPPPPASTSSVATATMVPPPPPEGLPEDFGQALAANRAVTSHLAARDQWMGQRVANGSTADIVISTKGNVGVAAKMLSGNPSARPSVPAYHQRSSKALDKKTNGSKRKTKAKSCRSSEKESDDSSSKCEATSTTSNKSKDAPKRRRPNTRKRDRERTAKARTRHNARGKDKKQRKRKTREVTFSSESRSEGSLVSRKEKSAKRAADRTRSGSSSRRTRDSTTGSRHSSKSS